MVSFILVLSIYVLRGSLASYIPLREKPYITTTAAGPDLPQATETSTGVSDCGQQGGSVFCFSDTTRLQAVIPATETGDITPSYTYTACHEHDGKSFCIRPDDSEIELLGLNNKASELNPEYGESFRSEIRETSPHIHGGIEHNPDDDEEKPTIDCSKKNTEYNIPLRIGLIFVIMVTSFIGISGPIFLKPILSDKFQAIFIVLKQFGTGVIIATAFVHLLTHAQLTFTNECVGELSYEATTSAVVMAGLFLAFTIETISHRVAKKFSTRSHYNDEIVSIVVLEAGILFHSVLVGITLVVAEDSFFITLFVVIVFHQMFEGVALGTRIASIGHHTNTDRADAGNGPEGQDKASSSSARDTAAAENGGDTDGSERRQSLSMLNKLLMATAFALTTPIGMAIGVGVLHNFNSNNPKTLITIGTLNALSAGILVWVGVVEMWAGDWMFGGELENAGPMVTTLAGGGLVAGMALMSLLGKWT